DFLAAILNLDEAIGLVMQIKDGLGVIVKASNDALNSQAAIIDSREEQRQSVSKANCSRRLSIDIDSKLVRQAANAKTVDKLQVLPKSLLVRRSRQALTLGEVLLSEEKCIHCNVASNLETLLLAQSDQLNVVCSGHRS